MIRSKASFAGNIDYHGKLFLSQVTQAHLLAPDVSNFDIEYIFWDILHLLEACFPAAKIENPADTSPEHNKNNPYIKSKFKQRAIIGDRNKVLNDLRKYYSTRSKSAILASNLF